MKNIFKKLFSSNEQKNVTVEDKEKKHKFLEVGRLYILITNNKDNLSVAEYLGEQYHYKENGEVKFSLSIFKDVVTDEEYFSMGKHIAFTEKRLKALSNMHYTDVVELMFHTEYEYECKDVPTKDVYIDPLENFEIIISSIKSKSTL